MLTKLPFLSPIANKAGISDRSIDQGDDTDVSAAAPYLDNLNPEQRRAVEHGAVGPGPFAPLLVIAGAGSGKTNTLAHRVAHLIVSGADPRRILLMTFSRRAASEMTKRVERIARKVMGANAGIMTDALSWAGTFHGIGARLLREYADQIGLNPAFTIHDREDSADLMNLVRHERGLSKTESRFPAKGTCLSIYSVHAATVRNILHFPKQFSPKAEIVTLDRNYRSTQPLLSAANGVIDLAKERFIKNLWTERISSAKPHLVAVRDEADQARYIVERILENREEGALLKQQAVLFRTSSHSGPLEVELTRRNIPFVKFGGLKFLDASHVKDMLALLRFAENPRDRVAGFRTLHLLPGVGPASAQRVLEHMADAADPIAALAGAPKPPRCADEWSSFCAAVAQLRQSEWPADLERARLWYEPH